MNYEEIEKIIQTQKTDQVYEIRFKYRNSIRGLIIVAPDYHELSRKNLWRIVSEKFAAEYKKTNNNKLSRIFNGSEFAKLEAE